MAIPDYQSLMLPVLEIACTGESSVPKAEAAISARFGLTPEESEQMLPSGKQRLLHNRIHWAKFYLTRTGFLETPRRGRFAITDSGRHLLAHPPETLNTKYLMSIPAFRDFRNGEDVAVPVVPVESDWATHRKKPWKPLTRPCRMPCAVPFWSTFFRRVRVSSNV